VIGPLASRDTTLDPDWPTSGQCPDGRLPLLRAAHLDNVRTIWRIFANAVLIESRMGLDLVLEEDATSCV